MGTTTNSTSDTISNEKEALKTYRLHVGGKKKCPVQSAQLVTPMKIIKVGQDESGGQEAMEIRDYSVKEWRHFVDHHRHRPNKHL